MPGDLEQLTGPNATPEKLLGGFGSVEGPVFNRLGYLLFSDTASRQIRKWEKGKLTTFREGALTTGLTFDHMGCLLACEPRRVTRTEKTGKITVLADQLHAPRDLVYAIDGSIYFTDGAIYQIRRRGEARVVSRDLSQPNGLALAPNQQKLYAGDTGAHEIRVYDISGDGALHSGRSFAQAAARGMKTDEEGNLWAAADHGIVVFSSPGERRGEISLPEDPSNFTWGDGFHDLYITAQTSIYKIKTKVNGTRTY